MLMVIHGHDDARVDNHVDSRVDDNDDDSSDNDYITVMIISFLIHLHIIIIIIHHIYLSI